MSSMSHHCIPSPFHNADAQLDRLILELRLTPLEAYWHLQRVLERVNAITSSLITSETFRLEETETFADNWEKVRTGSVPCGILLHLARCLLPPSHPGRQTFAPFECTLPYARFSQEWLFAPERGNVVFASSLYCWAFSIPTFARIWAGKLGVKRGLLARHLWGDFVFNPKTLAVSHFNPESKAKPMFVAMILDPIWQLYEVTVLDKDLEKAGKMIKRLDLVR